jgi:hypothetical protein
VICRCSRILAVLPRSSILATSILSISLALAFLFDWVLWLGDDNVDDVDDDEAEFVEESEAAEEYIDEFTDAAGLLVRFE